MRLSHQELQRAGQPCAAGVPVFREQQKCLNVPSSIRQRRWQGSEAALQVGVVRGSAQSVEAASAATSNMQRTRKGPVKVVRTTPYAAEHRMPNLLRAFGEVWPHWVPKHPKRLSKSVNEHVIRSLMPHATASKDPI
jgi:hypothetical protein